jgi:hypothetical protein
MARHNPRERKLFKELNDKNRMAEEFRRLSSRLRGWKKRLSQKKGKRWQKQYTLAIQRASERLELMRPELLARAEELKARIEEEQKLSKDEIKQFEKQYAKEVAELKQAQEALAEAREAVDEAKVEKLDPERAGLFMAELRQKRRVAAREARRESRELKKAEQEIASEEQDMLTLASEMRRIVAEIESLRM